MKKIKYIKPNTEEIAVPCYMLTSSRIERLCNKYCRIWHICRDREQGKVCTDFQY